MRPRSKSQFFEIGQSWFQNSSSQLQSYLISKKCGNYHFFYHERFQETGKNITQNHIKRTNILHGNSVFTIEINGTQFYKDQ
ncbi:hypothetical protein [Leptospira interrogans]|uniref:hypothetical protein n=1 Tax=Leptospira interrogans TaxID=173 RepID=UPI0002BB75F5|nr:hypothetical protein [Leptospira interrogans]MCR8649525.1 hypothetical protein [Leptospira interrogans serovar Bataviae]OAM85315.1 hypothetical protein A1343_18425 [Leptospira interrogans serovar Bataviae]QOI39143.1 hypothetical protein Lepto1548_13260 [Leptospira interrogans serovar Bataviae]QYY59419.1 hypothetical protein GR153_012295 [Leptospira interrogans serovar Bataviae]